MSNFTITYDSTQSMIGQAFGLSEERELELINKTESGLDHIIAGLPEENATLKSDVILKTFLSHAQNSQEAIFLAFVAGQKTEQVFGSSIQEEGGQEEGNIF